MLTINTSVVNINVNLVDKDFQETVLCRIYELNLEIKELKNMLNAAEQAIIDGFNAATTAIADRIAALIAQGNTDSPDFIAALNVELDALKAMGTNGPAPVVNPDPAPGADPVV